MEKVHGIGNYLKITIRNLYKHKTHSLINITGLSIGIAVCLLLFLWIQDELSYDKYHEKADQIYRVAFKGEDEGRPFYATCSPIPLGPAMLNEFPWIEKLVYLYTSNQLISCNGKLFEEDIMTTHSDILDFFTIPLVIGDKESVLKEPNSIIISQSMRKKFFGNTNPVGQQVPASKKKWRHLCENTGETRHGINIISPISCNP